MSFVLKRGALAFVVGLVVAVAAPAMAMATVTEAITSGTGFPAGGHPTVTATLGLDGAAGAATTLTTKLAPGVLANLNSNPACLAGTANDTAECQIGNGTIHSTAPFTASFTAYQVPVLLTDPAGSVAGVDIVIGTPVNATIHGDLSLSQLSSGNIQGILTVGPVAATVDGMVFNIDGTLPGGTHAGAPFTQMPTNCATPSPATTLSVAYVVAEGPVNASPDFAPTGCSSLPYTPTVAASAVRDSGDAGVALTTVISQTAGQANNAASTLSIPAATVSPNTAAISLTCTSSTFTGCTPVGTASVSSPLIPTAITGKAYLTSFTGTPPPGCPAATFGLTVAFPAPFAFNLCGTFANIVSATPSLTFASIPDLPITNLAVAFSGGPKAAFVSSCSVPNGTLRSAFTGQNGVMATPSAAVNVTNCPAVVPTPGKPTIKGISLKGVAKQHATLKLTVNKGSNAPNVKSFSVKLPGGISLTKKFKKGIKIGCGGGKFTAKKSGHTLKITLKFAKAKACLTAGPKALKVSNGLARQVQKKKVKKVKITIKVTDTKGKTTSTTVKVKVS